MIITMLQCINLYHEKLKKDYHMKKLWKLFGQLARDNSRTPMQWDDEINAWIYNRNTLD